jgi:phospholipid/cholesterol/gamma-HCH transport system substrate-binding protein
VSDYETKQKRQNVIVGFFVLIGLCALVWLIFKFGDLPIAVSEMKSFKITIQFPTAKGIEKNAPVEFCGYQIGKVTKVESPTLLKDSKTDLTYHQTRVILNIDKDYVNIPSTVEVKLMTRSLGSSFVELLFDPRKPYSPSDPNRPFLCEGMTLQGTTGMTSEFFPEESQQKLIELIDGVNTLVANANEVIGSRANKDNLKQILANLSQASGELQKTLDDIHKFTTTATSTLEHADSKIDLLASTVTTAGQNFQDLSKAGIKTLGNVDTTTDKMVASSDKLVTSMIDTTVQLNQAIGELSSILTKVNSGQGTAARLLNDNTAYEHLLENTEELQSTLKELKTLAEKWQDKKIKISLF